MPLINKFGHSNERINEFNVTRMIERALRKKTYLTLNSESEYDADNKRIANVGNPVEEGDCANKRYVEAIVWTEIHKFFNQEDLNMQFKRIKKLSLPVEDDDAASKRYVDNSLYHGYSVLMLRLQLDGATKNYIVKPFGSFGYEFPFDADVRISKTNLRESDTDVVQNDSVVFLNAFKGNFHYFPKGSKICFRIRQDHLDRLHSTFSKRSSPEETDDPDEDHGGKLKQNAYVELQYRSTI